ncbi:predicted protein [Histoplasma mississippiense (nom. inval.)]|uniref:predicted protein n=1 Tax=Ajellomyces capsulatus (strain NAm1 / WU24) TaxID=2059318 RepID=UPI000157D464|nr:predicted protein [Histoplasma mississippiense (nom. inval.)]EDN05218.1 predicted protein [Histoplasma mississippiense (nom. inval.)]
MFECSFGQYGLQNTITGFWKEHMTKPISFVLNGAGNFSLDILMLPQPAICDVNNGSPERHEQIRLDSKLDIAESRCREKMIDPDDDCFLYHRYPPHNSVKLVTRKAGRNGSGEVCLVMIQPFSSLLGKLGERDYLSHEHSISQANFWGAIFKTRYMQTIKILSGVRQIHPFQEKAFVKVIKVTALETKSLKTSQRDRLMAMRYAGT